VIVNDEGRPAPVIVDSWREENPLGSFSNEASSVARDVLPNEVPAAPKAGDIARRSTARFVGFAALAALAVSVTALLNSVVAPVPPPAATEAALVNRGPVSAPAVAEVGSAGQAPQTEVALESTELPQPAQNVPPIERATTPPVASSRIADTPARSLADVVQTPQVTSPGEQRAADREAVDDPPARLPDTPVGTLAFEPLAPMPIAPPTFADARAPIAAAATVSPPVGAAGRSAVASVLQRYAAAFSSLDVGEVKAVWPDVNEGALARAFSTLQDQRFDLGECDIWVTGASAVASCAGRASYTPKIGNRKPRSEPREWTFYLRQEGPQWSIGSVRTR
jgi:hypothetical protein